MVDFALQRKNMVESQVRPSDITDRRIIRAMLEVPRELFCPPVFRSTAYRDGMLQVNEAQGARARFTPAPRTLAKLIQALDIGDRDTILEIGAASGYATTVISSFAAKVVAVEPDPALAEVARTNLERFGAGNAKVIESDNAAGHAAGAPYDAILISGAVAQIPRAILDQLKDGGRLAAVIAGGNFGRLTLWRRIGGLFDRTVLADAAAPELDGFEFPKAFVF